MRKTFSIAVIFFVALTAQASARTFIKCVPEKFTYFPSGHEREIEAGVTFFNFTLSYDIRKESKIENLFLKGFGCRIINNESDELSIIFTCAKSPTAVESTMEVDRLTGNFFYKYENSEPNDDGDKKVQWTGSCRKIEQKF